MHEVILNNSHGFTCKEVWENTNLYCCKCGKQTLMKRTDASFYYGYVHLCTSCGFLHARDPEDDYYEPDNIDLERLKQLQQLKD